ncbi:MAG TPA: hypothetical protein VGP28_04535 [Methylocella sp.]|nr:hypothetical protein [Methylocella sp.]
MTPVRGDKFLPRLKVVQLGLELDMRDDGYSGERGVAGLEHADKPNCK